MLASMSSLELVEWQSKLSLDDQVYALITKERMDPEMAMRAIWTPKDY